MSKRISSRDFNQNVSAAKRAAEEEPVIITDRGRPALVLMSIEHYRHLSGERGSIVELLAMREDVEFETVGLGAGDLRVADLS